MATSKPNSKKPSKKRTKAKKKTNQQWQLPEGVMALILLLVSLFVLFLSLWQGNTGLIGGLLRPGLLELFGVASPLLGIWLMVYSLGLLLPGQKIDQRISVIGFILLQITVQLGSTAFAAGRDLALATREVYRSYGGLLGVWLYNLLNNLVGPVGLWLILALLALLSLSLLTRKPPVLLLRLMGNTAKKTLPSAERRQKMLRQGKVIWQHTRDVAEKAADKAVSSLQAENDGTGARQAELIALAAEGWHEEPVPVQQPEKKQRSKLSQPQQPPEIFATEGEWWMPRPGLVPDDELVLPGYATALSPSAPDQTPPAFGADIPGVFTTAAGQEAEQAHSDAPDPVAKTTPVIPNAVAAVLAPALSDLEPLAEDDLELFYEQDYEAAARARATADFSASVPSVQQRAIPDLNEEMAVVSLPSRYQPPPLSLLARPSGNRGLSQAELDSNSLQLEQTLEMFGVKAKVIEVSQGPTVTRYELQLAPGIRVNKVANLSDDIALSLAAMGVRIEAPIPGKAAIGIEVPNKETQTVMLSEILVSKEFREAKAPLTVALGKDIAGKPVVADLSRMPHLLLAGTTGSGKSVCMNTLICSILFRCSPEEVRLIMVDPKVVEMLNYNGIPHLLAPVVTDPKKAAGVLKIATKEMDRRYELFASLSVKNIGQYNERVLSENMELPTLPYWLIFIDELADLMMIAKEDVEHSITRISQLARAAGIHLVIGTQRPTTDVVTGIIKGNVPSRIAFAVSSGIDSRIILDSNGAEKLLGRGDMLFQPIGSFKPLRVQGAYISETEVDAVVAHVKMQGVPVYNEDIVLGVEESEEDAPDAGERDPLFMQAAQLVVEARLGSTSYLQRRLSVGYSRAGRIMDQLQEYGIVGPPKGSKSRDVLISREQLENLK